jgi:hypothetical protein
MHYFWNVYDLVEPALEKYNETNDPISSNKAKEILKWQFKTLKAFTVRPTHPQIYATNLLSFEVPISHIRTLIYTLIALLKKTKKEFIETNDKLILEEKLKWEMLFRYFWLLKQKYPQYTIKTKAVSKTTKVQRYIISQGRKKTNIKKHNKDLRIRIRDINYLNSIYDKLTNKNQKYE